MFNIFKNPSEVQIRKKDRYIEYLRKTSIENSGVVNVIDHEKVIDRNGNVYRVYRVSYLAPNGVNLSVDHENRSKVKELINSLEHDCKVMFPDEVKNNLDRNIEFFEKRMAETDDENLKECIYQRLEVMKIFNENKYVSVILFIDERDDDIFNKTASNVFAIECYTGKKLIDYLSMMNNEMK